MADSICLECDAIVQYGPRLCEFCKIGSSYYYDWCEYELGLYRDIYTICSMCGKRIEIKDSLFDGYGNKYYCWHSVETGREVCKYCSKNGPKSDYCKVCKKRFPSRNKLFKHLLHNKEHIV